MQPRIASVWLAASSVYLSIALFSINKPLTLDQARPTAWNAGAIARYGFGALGDASQGYEISHTLLHQHILAVSFRLFGETTVAARLVGALCFLGVLLMIVKLSLALFSQQKGIIIGATAAFLYAANPFMVQQSLLVDQETTILPLALLLFIYALYRFDFRVSRKSAITLGVLFALCIWAKELTPFFLLIALGPFLWMHRGLRGALSLTAGVAVVGVGVFVATWSLYCAVTGVPLLSFVEFSILEKALSPSFHSHRTFLGMKNAFLDLTKLATPIFIALFVLAAIRRVRLFLAERFRGHSTDYLWVYAAMFWAITNLHMYQFARYQYPLYSVVVILIAEFLYALLADADRKRIVVAAGIGLAIAIVMAVLLPETHRASQSEYALWWVSMPLAVSAAAILFLRVPVLSRQYLGLTALCLFLATNVSLGIQQTRPFTTAMSWYEYGEEGFASTLAYLRANVGDTVPIVRKDLGYYLEIDQPDRAYEWIYNSLFRTITAETGEGIRQTIVRDDVKIIVLDMTSNPKDAANMISEYYSPVRKFGDFEIFEKRSADQDEP